MLASIVQVDTLPIEKFSPFYGPNPFCNIALFSCQNTSPFGAQDRGIATFSPFAIGAKWHDSPPKDLIRLVLRTRALAPFLSRGFVPNGTVHPPKYPICLVNRIVPLRPSLSWQLVSNSTLYPPKYLICVVPRTKRHWHLPFLNIATIWRHLPTKIPHLFGA